MEDNKVKTWDLIEKWKRENPIIASMDDLVFVLDERGVFTDFFQPKNHKLIMPPEAFLGKGYGEVLPFHVYSQLEKAMENLETRSSVENFEYSLKLEDEEQWFHTKVTKFEDEANQKRGFVVVSRDITAYKILEKQREKERISFKELYTELFNRINSGVAMYEAVDNGSDFKFVDFNKKAEELEGVSKKDLLGRKVTEVFPGVKKFGLFDVFKRVWESGEPENFHLKRYVDDRIQGWRNNYVYKMSTGEIVAVYEDVTTIKKAEEEKALLLEMLQKKNYELEAIINVTSHDLKAPLVNMAGFTTELLNSSNELKDVIDNLKISDENREVVERTNDAIKFSEEFIMKNLKLFARLLDGLRDFCRVGQVSVEFIPIDMHAIVSDLIAIMKFKLDEAGINITVGDLPKCKGDVTLIKQIFLNLIDNAVKYRSSDRKGQIKITGEIKEDSSIFCVEDNGIGMASRDCEKIFDIYYQVKADEDGSGMGLTIIKRLVDKLEGDVWVESTPGVGSKFYVSLKNLSSD